MEIQMHVDGDFDQVVIYIKSHYPEFNVVSITIVGKDSLCSVGYIVHLRRQ